MARLVAPPAAGARRTTLVPGSCFPGRVFPITYDAPSMASRRSSRTLTVFAAGFLALDGVLLVLAGLWSDRGSLLGWGVACVMAALTVFAYWRRHVRQLEALDVALEERRLEFQRLAQELENRRGQ